MEPSLLRVTNDVSKMPSMNDIGFQMECVSRTYAGRFRLNHLQSVTLGNSSWLDELQFQTTNNPYNCRIQVLASDEAGILSICVQNRAVLAIAAVNNAV